MLWNIKNLRVSNCNTRSWLPEVSTSFSSSGFDFCLNGMMQPFLSYLGPLYCCQWDYQWLWTTVVTCAHCWVTCWGHWKEVGREPLDTRERLILMRICSRCKTAVCCTLIICVLFCTHDTKGNFEKCSLKSSLSYNKVKLAIRNQKWWVRKTPPVSGDALRNLPIPDGLEFGLEKVTLA